MSAPPDDWIRLAEADLRVAQILLDRAGEAPLGLLGFHCQQACEKALKGLLAARGASFARRHDLRYLLDLCAETGDALPELEERIDGLTPYAVEFRYPTDFPVSPSVEEAGRFVANARVVLDVVRGRIAQG